MNAPLIDRGLYTVGDAARLLKVSPARVRGWIAGYPRTKSDPILRNDVGWLDGSLAFSFANLMEIRFIEHFTALKVRTATIREMAREAERVLRHPHPFATKTVFQTDGKKIFAEIAESTGDQKLYDLRDKNWAMLQIIEQSLHREVTYDPSGDAAIWTPRPAIPSVVVHPRMSFGQPILKKEGIPTRALFEAFQAEGDDADSVAKWFQITPDQVREAVEFEINLAMAA
ncbi:MAG TPA: DUF433 domain-containing protein [Rhizomicrobium sp.]|nr:DUF433 domain-containing protein [Rhizomicrobium sp.]